MPQSALTVLARLAVALTAVALLGGCATPYQAVSFGGGYREREVGPNRWYVEFFGNGRTTLDTVTAYWLYRCADLTSQKGFDYFVLVSKTPPPEARFDALRAAREREEDRQFIPLESGAGVPVYVPAATIRSWSRHGVIELRNGDAEDDDRPNFVAKTVLDKLGPQVRIAMQRGRNIVLPKDFAVSEEDGPPSASGPV